MDRSELRRADSNRVRSPKHGLRTHRSTEPSAFLVVQPSQVGIYFPGFSKRFGGDKHRRDVDDRVARIIALLPPTFNITAVSGWSPEASVKKGSLSNLA